MATDNHKAIYSMSRTSKKYRSYGIRRENNLADLSDSTISLNNLLNNIPGVSGERTFISEDLDVIRGLKDTDITTETFASISGTAPTETVFFDANNNPIENPFERVIEPIIRLEDRAKLYRTYSEENPVFSSGMGPNVYFVPSDSLPSITPGANTATWFQTIKANSEIETSNDFWALGEFVIDDRFRPTFPDSNGGLAFEGYFLPNPAASSNTFRYITSGLFHVEYQRFADDPLSPWIVLKSIYSKKRTVTVSSVAGLEVTLASGNGRFVSTGDFIDGDPENLVTDVNGDVVTLTTAIVASPGSTITFDMNFGTEEYVSGEYEIPDILDRAEVPQIKKRIIWWFPQIIEGGEPVKPDAKYLSNRIVGRAYRYDYYYLHQEPASSTSSEGSVRNLLDTAVSAVQEQFGGQTEASYRKITAEQTIVSTYEPRSSLSSVTRNISFVDGNRTATGNFADTEIGHYILPSTVADLNVTIPKGMRIKDLFGSNTASNVRIVNLPHISTQTSYSVRIVDHNGLVDFFVGTSSGNVVTLSQGTAANLKKDMICVTSSTGASDFVRIVSVDGPTQITTSAPLGITADYIYIYANVGLIDRSLVNFCANVFGQVLDVEAASGTNVLTLRSTDGISNGLVVQLQGYIASGTTVTNVNTVAKTVTLSSNLLATIEIGTTITFAPAGTSVNKEICVLPIDLSPPFLGVDTGLSTNGFGIASSKSTFNVRFANLSINNATPSTIASPSTTNYDTKISTETTVVDGGITKPIFIIADKV